MACFRNNVHHHKEIPGTHRSAHKKVADTVAYNSPLRASAALLGRMPALRPCVQPSDKEHTRARRRLLSKQMVRRVAIFDGVLAWQQRIADRAAFNSQQMSDGFLFFPLRMDDSDWLRCLVLRKLHQVTVPIGSCVFMSRHMVRATRAYIAAGGVWSLNEGMLLLDWSWRTSRDKCGARDVQTCPNQMISGYPISPPSNLFCSRPLQPLFLEHIKSGVWLR